MPVVLLVDSSGTRDRAEMELRKRYGADYQVMVAGSAGEAYTLSLHDALPI